MAELLAVDWTGVPYGVFDAIQSFLVEHPNSYYMAANRQWLCYLTREHGLLKLVHDYTIMDDIEVTEYIVGALELLYDPQED